MIDILFPIWGREDFTEAAQDALVSNTRWGNAHVVEYSRSTGPVAIMNDYLSKPGSEIFAKIDNDTIVPPGWLDQALMVMEENPELDLLGIEPPASRTPAPWLPPSGQFTAPELTGPHVLKGSGNTARGYAPCDMIGGIGLMRRRAFAGRLPMQPHGPLGTGGFSDWQLQHPEVTKGWIIPPLNVFLLDRLPIEPWASLSKRYIAEGVQRPWTNYSAEDSHLWEWWLRKQVA